FALRVLSVLATIGSLRMIFVLGRRFGGESLAWLSSAVFITLDPVQVAMVSARPYALALFFALAAVWALLRWEEDGRYRYSALYLFCFVSSVYLQYLFVCMLALHILHVVLFFRAQRVPLASLVSELILVGTTLVPAYLHMRDLAARSGLLQFVPEPTAVTLVRALLPPALSIAAVMALIFTLCVATNRSVQHQSARSRLGLWLAWWYLLPPLLFFLLSRWGGVSIFLERYFLFYTPAVSFVFAALILGWRDERVRAMSVAAFVAVLLVREVDRRWVSEDWRGAARLINERDQKIPVLVYPGLAEARDLQWLHDEGRQEYLLSPLIYYRVRNPMAVVPPPSIASTEDGQRYLEQTLSKLANQEKRVLFVGIDQRTPQGSTVTWWKRQLTARGYELQELSLLSGSLVRVFEVTAQGSKTGRAPDDQHDPTIPADSAGQTPEPPPVGSST
ncbi:MAG: hypothetical protein EBZ48_06305, partial [Proteobacteria bacterium]|nr:hypothetical protein [Pseudomonadota bacterium]